MYGSKEECFLVGAQPTSEREKERERATVYRVMHRTKHSQYPRHIVRGMRRGWGKEEIKSAVPQSFGDKDAIATASPRLLSDDEDPGRS